MIEIDGTTGEGGGQVLRTSLALSLCTGKPFHIVNIRGNRSRPGLMRQHLTGVQAATQIGNAKVSGDKLRSRELTFSPGPVTPGDYAWDIGTAGSANLVLQTILPPLMLANGPSTVDLRGGTHNSASPPYEFLHQAFLPVLARFGPEVDLELLRYGFYPKGGGRLKASIQPCETLHEVHLEARGEVQSIKALTLTSQLPEHIGRREINVVRGILTLAEAEQREVESPGPGNVLVVTVQSEHITEVFTGFGVKGLRAEAIARGIGDKVEDYIESDVPVGAHLADQLLIPMALAGAGRFKTSAPTPHTRTNAQIIKKFLDVSIVFAENDDFTWTVEVR